MSLVSGNHLPELDDVVFAIDVGYPPDQIISYSECLGNLAAILAMLDALWLQGSSENKMHRRIRIVRSRHVSAEFTVAWPGPTIESILEC
ncbi:hypothetical protein XcuCFBP2542_04270 [Xanthomonas cucurbitae]|uniref:Uncharacterized protein n=1 Tax=Xanthomonas cucurbitae TaxID=56453 RepID=A0A2S7DV76_9XANT|nr:hypothetical protein XcuCFBP2542_04270 [Xanthomonas cucurbitae]QHG88169.1 hypothetical protein EBN15_15675 [Xanthomonas cucurbitae]